MNIYIYIYIHIYIYRLGTIAVQLVLMLTDNSRTVVSEVVGADTTPSILIKMNANNVLMNEEQIGVEREKASSVSSSWSCTLPFTDTLIANLADLFSCNKDIDTLLDNNLCIFLRTILGYQPPPPSVP
jgi:hypothetical protein